MKKRFLKLLFLSGTLLSLLTACEYDYIVPTPPPPVIENDTISYSQDIQPIFTAQCASCHPAVYKPDLTAGKSYNALISGDYVVAGNPSSSSLYTKCSINGSMYTYFAEGKEADQLLLISRWITAGAKND